MVYDVGDLFLLILFSFILKVDGQATVNGICAAVGRLTNGDRICTQKRNNLTDIKITNILSLVVYDVGDFILADSDLFYFLSPGGGITNTSGCGFTGSSFLKDSSSIHTIKLPRPLGRG